MSNFINSTLIPILGIIFVLLVIKRPFWGLVLLCGSLPVASSLPDISGLTSIAVPIGGVTVAAYIINRIINRKAIEINPTSMAIYVLAALLTGLMVVGQWVNPATLYIRDYGLTYIQLTLLVILCDQLLRSEQKIHTMMLVYIAAIQITALVAVSQFLSYAGPKALFRPSGDTGNANSMGIYTSISIIMCVYFIQTTRNGFVRIFTIVGLLTSTSALILSGSRGAVLFLIPVILYQLVRGGKKSIQLLLLGLVTFVLISGFIPGNYWQRIAYIPNALSDQSDTVVLRYKLWSLALKAWQDSPIWGIGPGAVDIVLADSNEINASGSYPAHNMYITSLAENGLIGLTVFATILLLTTFILLRLDWVFHRKNRNFTLLIIAWQATLAVILLNGVKVEWGANKLLWMCVGVSLALYGGTQFPKLTAKRTEVP